MNEQELNIDLNDDLNDRKDLIRAIETIIQLYTDKVHFIYELLQNAEDCKATKVKFDMFSDRLEVLHNGEPFTKENLTSIRSIALTTKIEQVNAIGKFGVGFKSVFGICKDVIICSNKNNFKGQNNNYLEDFIYKINDFRYLEDVDEETKLSIKLLDVYTTKFIFLFCVSEKYSGYKKIETLHEKLSSRLSKLGTSVLLFMRNIKEISYSVEGLDDKLICHGTYSLKKDNIGKNSFKITATGDKEIDNISYLLFSRSTRYNKDVNIAFACKWKENGDPVFSSAPEKNICVYFPTDTPSNVNFVVQAPYGTTPNRGGIPDTDENKYLSNELATLLHDAIIEIKDRKWLTLELINLLPYKAMGNEDNWFLYNLYKKTIQLLKTESVIPCIDGSYITSNKAKIVKGGKLLHLFKDKLLCDFIKQPGAKWLSDEFTKDNYKELHPFFINDLDMEEIEAFNDLPRLIKNNPSFFYNVSEFWLKDFYSYLYENVPSLLGKNGHLATIPFIKTNDRKFNAPYRINEKGQKEQNIFLRPESASIDIKDFLFLDDFIIQSCPDFVEALGLEEPDDYDYFIKELENINEMKNIDDNLNISQIKHAIKYLKDNHYENAVEKFRCLLKLKLIDTFEKEQYSVILKNNIFLTIYREKDQNNLSIKDYFSEINCNVLFLDEIFYEKNGVSSQDLSILELLGIKNNIYIGINEKEWKDGVSKCSNKENFRKRLNFENIDNILSYIKNKYNKKSKEKSKIILKLLMNVERHLYGQWQSKATNPYEDDVSNIINTLRSEKWLYSSKGKQVKPYEISRYDLDTEIYGHVDEDTKIFKLLGFKEDIDKILLNDFDSKYTEEQKIKIYNHICDKLYITPTVLLPSKKLIEIYEKWISFSDNKKLSMIKDYENNLYPGWYKREDLKSDPDSLVYNKAWFTLFAIAICQQKGWSSDEKNKNFLIYLNDNLWFDTMIKSKSESEWMNIIKEYYKFNTNDQEWQEWVKLLPQFFIIRYYMDDYIMIIRNLNNIDSSEEFELDTILKPNTNPLLRGSGIKLPALNRTLRLGLPFIIRELLRFDILNLKKNIICHAFMPKDLTAKIVMEEEYVSGNNYTSRYIFKVIDNKLEIKKYTIDKYYDIPLLLFYTGKL